MARSLRCIPVLLCVSILAVGCADGPVSPTDDSVLPAPEFLIGDSPLIIFLVPPLHTLNVEGEVTKGIMQAADNGRFWFRASTTFEIDGHDPVGLQPCVDKPTPAKQELIKGGSTVGFIMDINIPIDDWTKLVSAANLGAEITAHVTVELLLIDGAGKEHVMDTAAATSNVDPNG